MTTITYLDFDLLNEGSKVGYHIRVLNSLAGLALPFSDPELENSLLHVGRPQQRVRRLRSPGMEVASAFC